MPLVPPADIKPIELSFPGISLKVQPRIRCGVLEIQAQRCPVNPCQLLETACCMKSRVCPCSVSIATTAQGLILESRDATLVGSLDLTGEWRMACSAGDVPRCTGGGHWGGQAGPELPWPSLCAGRRAERGTTASPISRRLPLAERMDFFIRTILKPVAGEVSA